MAKKKSRGEGVNVKKLRGKKLLSEEHLRAYAERLGRHTTNGASFVKKGYQTKQLKKKRASATTRLAC